MSPANELDEAFELAEFDGTPDVNRRPFHSGRWTAFIDFLLGLTHMVDDRVGILNSMTDHRSASILVLARPGRGASAKADAVHGSVSASWTELVEQVTATLR